MGDVQEEEGGSAEAEVVKKGEGREAQEGLMVDQQALGIPPC